MSMTAKQERTSAPLIQQPASKVELFQSVAGTKKSSPAPTAVQDWIDAQLANAPELTAGQLKRIGAILGGAPLEDAQD